MPDDPNWTVAPEVAVTVGEMNTGAILPPLPVMVSVCSPPKSTALKLLNSVAVLDVSVVMVSVCDCNRPEPHRRMYSNAMNSDFRM